MTTDVLTHKAAALAAARQDYEQKKALLDALRQAWEAEHAAEIEAVTTAKQAMEQADESLREETLRHFAATSEARPIAGLEVKQTEEINLNLEAARQWALTHMPCLLVLDRKAYEMIFREVSGSPTLQKVVPAMPGDILPTPKVFIARDLSAYLPGCRDCGGPLDTEDTKLCERCIDAAADKKAAQDERKAAAALAPALEICARCGVELDSGVDSFGYCPRCTAIMIDEKSDALRQEVLDMQAAMLDCPVEELRAPYSEPSEDTVTPVTIILPGETGYVDEDEREGDPLAATTDDLDREAMEAGARAFAAAQSEWQTMMGPAQERLAALGDGSHD